MPDPGLLLAFVAAATILTLTPGVDTAMVLRAATVSGRRAGAGAALGIALGCLVWGAAVSLGLGAVLRASAVAYSIVRVAGAAYLVWLGVKLILKPRASLDVDAGQVPPTGEAFRRGLVTNLLNPKVGVIT